MIFSKALHTEPKTKRLVWLHGWGNNHRWLMPLADYFCSEFENYVLDLPGFGESTTPDSIWGVQEYAQAIHDWLATLEEKPTYFIGHSFGGKLSVVLANEYPKNVAGIVLLAAAGMKVKRNFFLKIKIFIIKHLTPIAKLFEKITGLNLRERFGGLVGSSDYNNTSGIMRRILIKAANETIYEYTNKVSCPALIIYGNLDTVTPPYMGSEYAELIKKAKLVLLDDIDHNTILTSARFQVQNLINDFINHSKES
ncbi:MAG: alpha/beta hydrolase [Deltaproteobacteria bacterium]|jgi:pimeloyl-ACP methyl ester carboxylesterase|nr:alpha/beta hydrolase [Deltaproteobacteria bacterium]